MVLRVRMMQIELAKMLKEKDALSFATKRRCATQTHGFKRSSGRHTVWVKMNIRLLCFGW